MQRQPGESPNDHSDRAIRRAAEWYQVQLGDAVEVLLLTNDVDNKKKASSSTSTFLLLTPHYWPDSSPLTTHHSPLTTHHVPPPA